MTDNACPVLQSGFVAFPGTQLVRPETKDQNDSIMSVLKTGKLAPSTSNPYFFSDRVCELFSMYMADTNLLSRFEYREMVLVEAIKLLSVGRRPLSAWFELQNESTTVSSLHKRFLIDTLRFIDGNGRTVSLENWQSMLVAPKRRMVDLSPSVDFRSKFVSFSETATGFIPHKTEEALVRWTSTPNGFRDVLMFLFIVFGKRASVGG